MKSSLYCSAALVPALFLLSALDHMAHAMSEDEIVITASPIAKTQDEILIGASVLDKEALSSRLAATIGETIKKEPGVSSSFFGPGASRPIIRGQGGNRVSVLTNGLGALDASSASPDHAVSIDPASAERVEIIRGPGILRYGSAATGGVVNIIDGRIKSRIPDTPLAANIRLGATSVDQGWESAGAIDIVLDKSPGQAIILHFDGAKRSAQDYKIPGFAKSYFRRIADGLQGAKEVLPNSAVDVESFAGALTWLGQKGAIGYSLAQANSFYGVPGGDEAVSIELEQTRHMVKGDMDIEIGPFQKVQFVTGFGDYYHGEVEPGGDTGTIFTNQGWEGRLELLHKEVKGFAGAMGMQYLARDFAAIGEEAFTPPTNTKSWAGYIFEDFQAGPWLFELGLRHEFTKHSLLSTGVAQEFKAQSISLGGRYAFTDAVSLGLTIFRNERAPAIEELYSNGPHLATNQYEIGDSTLGLEIAKGMEVVMRGEALGNKIKANIFYTNYGDYIYLAPTGLVQNDLPVFSFAKADANFQGFEFELERDIGAWKNIDFYAQGNLDFVRARLDSAGNRNLPQIPPMSALFGVEAIAERFTLRGEVEWLAAQNHVADFEQPTNASLEMNILATWQPMIERDNLKIRLSALNITNEEIRQHASPLKELISLPGRNFRLSLEASF